MSAATPSPAGPAAVRRGGARTAVVVVVMLAVALLHVFRVGSRLPGSWHGLYYAYFSDVVVPFGVYFLLCQAETRLPLLRGWRTKALAVLGVASLAEVMQSFGVPMLGSTFDPLDFAMYGAGVALAVAADRVVLAPLLPGWSAGGEGHTPAGAR